MAGYQEGWVWGFERLVLTIEPMTFQQSTMPSDLMIMFKINILWKVQLDIDLISQMHAGLVLLESQKQGRVGAKCQIIKAAAVCIEVVDIQQRCTTRCYLRSAGLNLNLQYRSQMKVESPRCRQSSPRQHSSPSPPPASQSFQSLAGEKKTMDITRLSFKATGPQSFTIVGRQTWEWEISNCGHLGNHPDDGETTKLNHFIKH